MLNLTHIREILRVLFKAHQKCYLHRAFTLNSTQLSQRDILVSKRHPPYPASVGNAGLLGPELAHCLLSALWRNSGLTDE